MLRYYEYDIDLRAEEGKPRAGTDIEVSVLEPGDALEVDGIAVRVDKGTHHGNVDDILSYAFEAEGRKIVIASDGSPTEALVPLARGADVLVMHPCIPELIDERFGSFRATARSWRPTTPRRRKSGERPPRPASANSSSPMWFPRWRRTTRCVRR